MQRAFRQEIEHRDCVSSTSGEKAGDPFYDDYKPADDQLTDIVRWIDTDVMIADPLTKVMEPTKLVEALKTNTLDVEQCEEASQAASKIIDEEGRGQAVDPTAPSLTTLTL